MPYEGLTIKRDFAEYHTEYNRFVSKFQKEIADISDFSTFAFIIWISYEIAEDSDIEYKAITIAHEFQHVLQWIKHECLMIQDFLIRKYLRITGAYSETKKHNFPIEIDADRRAVQICKKITNNNFIKQKIVELELMLKSSRNPRTADRKEEWGHYDTIDLMKPFILVDESAIRWKKWETEIDILADKIERKAENKEAEEIEFQKAYIYYKRSMRST